MRLPVSQILLSHQKHNQAGLTRIPSIKAHRRTLIVFWPSGSLLIASSNIVFTIFYGIDAQAYQLIITISFLLSHMTPVLDLIDPLAWTVVLWWALASVWSLWKPLQSFTVAQTDYHLHWLEHHHHLWFQNIPWKTGCHTAAVTVRNTATSLCKSGDENPEEPASRNSGKMGRGTGHFSFPCKWAVSAKVYPRVRIQHTESNGPSCALCMGEKWAGWKAKALMKRRECWAPT